MLHTEGELFVRSFRGRHGRFNIGKLVTDVGEFSVKDVSIDELDEGAYLGSFAIERLFLVNSQLPSGAIIVEMRARLATMTLHADRPTATVEAVGIEERDPIDEPEAVSSADAPAQSPAPGASSEPEQQDPTEISDADTASSDESQLDPDAALFAELWPLGTEVRLDPAVGRPLMRQQIDALKRRGYRYNAQHQVWRLAA